MSDKQIKKTISSKTFAGAPSSNVNINLNLNNSERLLNENNFLLTLDESIQYDKERQNSQFYTIYGNINVFPSQFGAKESGFDIETDKLFFGVDGPESSNPIPGKYLTFINDSHIIQDPPEIYNWDCFLTYPKEKENVNFVIQYITGGTFTVPAFDGIPFVINTSQNNFLQLINISGSNLTTIFTLCDHNVSVGEYITINIGGIQKYYEVKNVGANFYGSERRVIQVRENNLDVSGGTKIPFRGSLKRVINPENPETTSEYYVRKHSIISTGFTTNHCSFSNSLFGEQTFIFNFPNKINISSFSDEHGKPISECYLTFFKKDYNNTKAIILQNVFTGIGSTTIFSSTTHNLEIGELMTISGITTKVFRLGDDNNFNQENLFSTKRVGDGKILTGSTFTSQIGSGLTINYQNYISKIIYDWDLPHLWFSGTPNNVTYSSLSGGYTGATPYSGFTINNSYSGKFIGDFVEFNPFEIETYVLSNAKTKIINSTLTNQTMLYEGMVFNSHKKILLREYSTEIESGIIGDLDTHIPAWARFSEFENLWRWKEFLPHGFIFNDGDGTNYPYLNDQHYIYNNLNFHVRRERQLISKFYNSDLNLNIDNKNTDIKTEDCNE